MHGAAEVCTDAGGHSVFRGGLWLKVHVGVTCRAARNHFKKCKVIPCTDFRCGKPVLNGENLIKQPFVQRKVTPHAAQQCHWRVGVAVDEAGGEQAAAHILFLIIDGLRPLFTDIVDFISVNAKETILDAAEIPAFRCQDCSVFQKQFHAFPP